MPKEERKPTFEQTLRAYQTLKKQGIKPTRRALLKMVGGSPNILQEHVKMIEEIERRSSTANYAIPDYLERTVVCAISEHVERKTIHLHETIDSLTEDLQETNGQLASALEKSEALQGALEQQEEKSLEKRMELERRIAAALQKTKDLEQHVSELEARLRESREKCKEAEVQKAALATRFADHSDRLQRAIERQKELQQDLAAATHSLQAQMQSFERERRKMAAELRRAETACAQAQKRVAVLEVQLAQYTQGPPAPSPSLSRSESEGNGQGKHLPSSP